MARKKRLNTAAVLHNESVVKPKEDGKAASGYQAAAYVRLSLEDSGKQDGYSLQNQKDLLLSFIREHSDLQLYKMYVDNGFTGTNFQRPAFEEMMDDIKAGLVNCVVVKDLSRLGRNYLEAGNYLEQVFPFFKVRFIAVTEGYDSISPDFTDEALIIPLKNIINECYAKDISMKVSSAFATRKKQGKFMQRLPVYGYLKDPADKNHLIIDPDTAPIVQRIFQMAGNDISPTEIARLLNDEGIPSLSQYFVLKGFLRGEKYSLTPWRTTNVKRVLTNRMYLGCLVYGKTSSSIVKGTYRLRIPKEDWKVVENTHEPLITPELFEQVQVKLDASSRKSRMRESYPADAVENLFVGKIRCGFCGGAMSMSRDRKYDKSGKPYYYGVYVCCRHALSPSHRCPQKGFTKRKLDRAVLEALRFHIHGFVDQTGDAGAGSLSELTPEIVQEFISEVRVFGRDRVEIQFRFEDEFRKAAHNQGDVQ